MIFGVLMPISAIVTSRKRKLRELFAVATHVGDLPDNGFANPDTQVTTPTEWQFQQASDILQYVGAIDSLFL
jgi:chromatin modification-related protein VID21